MRYSGAGYFWDRERNHRIQTRRKGMFDADSGGQRVAASQTMRRGSGAVAHIHRMMMQLQGMRIRSQRHPQHQDRGQQCDFSIMKYFHGSASKMQLLSNVLP